MKSHSLKLSKLIAVTLFLYHAPHVAAEVHPATQENNRERFREFCQYVTDQSGWWESPLDAADTSNPFTAFYYESKKLSTRSGIHISIHGRHRSGQLIAFWDVIAYWNEREKRADHLQLGARGEIGTGQEKMVDSATTEIITSLLPPDGIGYTFRDYHTRISATEMRSESSILDSLGNWVSQGILNWRRAEPQIEMVPKK